MMLPSSFFKYGFVTDVLIIFFSFAVVFILSCSDNANTSEPSIEKGRIIYHSYSDYGAYDSKLHILDLKSGKHSTIGENWNIDHAMNAHFSSDGKKIAFMGVPKGSHSYYSWDVFLWDFISEEPVNLTFGNGLPDEDPKFSPNGNSIVFKQNGDIKIMDLQGNILETLTNDGFEIEESMPYFLRNGKEVIYAQGAGENSDIYKINIESKVKHPLIEKNGSQEYYPIVKNENTYLYAGWISAENRHDQIYIGTFDNSAPRQALFNSDNADFSDPYPIDENLVVFSTNLYSGNYDLSFGNLATGEIISLDSFGINTQLHELGACYILSY